MRYPDAPRNDTVKAGDDFAKLVAHLIKKELNIDIGYFDDAWHQLNVGESLKGVEVKLDETSKKTGNVAIEVAEKSKASNKEWVPSGIYRRDNTRWYVIGYTELIRVFNVIDLRDIDNGRYSEPYPTLRRFLLTAQQANRLCKGTFISGKYIKQEILMWQRDYAKACAKRHGDEIPIWLL